MFPPFFLSLLSSELREKHNLLEDSDPPLFSMPSKSFTVGKLNSKFPSPVFFFQDRCEYNFIHPFEAKQITMIMYYRDMSYLTLDKVKYKMVFKVPRQLGFIFLFVFFTNN